MEQQPISDYELELMKQMSNQQPTYNNPYSSFGGTTNKQNLIEFELDFSNEMTEIARLLRADVYIINSDGSGQWVANPDKSKVFFNDLGVNDILRELKLLVNKGKVLSYYNIEEINARVRQLKHEIRTKIYNNYEVYGMDNEYKMNNYTMIVLTIGSIIEDAYRRALNGETHKGLAEQRLVTQNESVNQMPQMNFNMGNQQQKSSWYKPWTWGK